jgi:hypothetical protein
MSTTLAQEQRSYINVGQENSTEIELYWTVFCPLLLPQTGPTRRSREAAWSW